MQHHFPSVAVTAFTMFLVASVTAQNTSPYWSVAGNSNATTSAKLGTINAVNVRMLTKNIERLRIDTLGRVGIGTTAPVQKLHVAGTGVFTGNVGIGTTAPAKKLHVVGTSLFTSTLTISNGGISVKNTTGSLGNAALDANGSLYGITSQGGSYGVFGYSVNGTGLYGSSTNNIGVNGVGRTGVYGTSAIEEGSGVFGYSTGKSGWGVQAFSAFSNGLVAFTGSSGFYAGYFNGSVFSSGTYQGSDRSLKQNIEEVSSAMDIINQLHPKSYNFRQDSNYKLMNLPKGRHYGLIAQEVEQVLPDLVKATSFDSRMAATPAVQDSGASLATSPASQASETITFKALNYTELIPIVIKGMQEQDAENRKLKIQVTYLEERIQKLEALLNTNTNIPVVTPAYLEQNNPNPVSGTTTIRYHIPYTATVSKVIITDAIGQQVKVIALNNTGAGQVTFNTTVLAAGIYNYTLWVDGNVADTKRFVLAK